MAVSDGPRLPHVDDETRETILEELDRAEDAAAETMAIDPDTEEVDEEAAEKLRGITRLTCDIVRGQLFGKEYMKGQDGDADGV